MKYFNRKNELLADAAERAAVAAEWLAGLPYPAARLREAWIRVLWHQFHDDGNPGALGRSFSMLSLDGVIE